MVNHKRAIQENRGEYIGDFLTARHQGEAQQKHSRNFANKLWNAARFVLMNLDEDEPAPHIPGELELQDRWILSRFINADSLFLAGDDAIGGTNMYAYCNCNPVMYADPSGRGPFANWIGNGLKGVGTAWAKSAIQGGELRNYGARIWDVVLFNVTHPFSGFWCTTIRIVGNMIEYALDTRRGLKRNVPAWFGYLVDMYDPSVANKRQFRARLFLGPVNYSWGEKAGTAILGFEPTKDNRGTEVYEAKRRNFWQWQRYLGYNPAYDFVFRLGGEIMVKKFEFDCKPFSLAELGIDAAQGIKAWRREQSKKNWDALESNVWDIIKPAVSLFRRGVETVQETWDRLTERPREVVFDLITPDPRHYRLWIWTGDYWNLGAGAEIGIYETPSIFKKFSQTYEVNPLNLLRGHVVLNYKKPDPNHPELTNPIIDYDNENWWVCVFRPKAQFPAVIENVDLTWTVNFLGNDLGDIGDLFNWIGTFIAQWLPTAAALSLSIPPAPEDLWKAFRKAMFDKYYTNAEMAKVGLHLDGTNEFRLIFNKGTNKPTA